MVLFNPKLKTLYTRNDKFKVTDTLTDERYRLVERWHLTEKMDGTSVIISIHNGADGAVSYYGRTAKSQFTPALHNFMSFTGHDALFSLADHGISQADIYAELVGPGVQGNPHGFDELQLFVFDVRIGDFWLDWHNVKSVAEKADLRPAPEWEYFMDIQATTHAMQYPEKWDLPSRTVNPSGATTDYLEGVVARTDPLLYTNKGDRLMWKLKVSDFPDPKDR